MSHRLLARNYKGWQGNQARRDTGGYSSTLAYVQYEVDEDNYLENSGMWTGRGLTSSRAATAEPSKKSRLRDGEQISATRISQQKHSPQVISPAFVYVLNFRWTRTVAPI